MRCFIAIKLEPAVVAEVSRQQSKLELALPRDAVRWARPDQVHLTLRFLGEVEDQQAGALEQSLRQTCEGCAALKLQLEGLGCFPNASRPRVVWLGIGGDVTRLSELQSRVESATAAFSEGAEDREFSAHLTIGRVRAKDSRVIRRVGQAVAAAKVGKLGEWTAKEVTLFSSVLSPQGPTHTELASILLRS